MAHWLIVSGAARALAQSCVDAGMRCDVIDPWGDADLQAIATRYRHCPLDGANFGDELLAHVKAMAAGVQWDGIVTGSGFEGHAGLLDRLNEVAPVIGNDASTVERCKSPDTFALAVSRAGLRVAEVRARGELPAGWLVKPLGGCGGLGVRRARTGETVPLGCYGQRHVAGRSASVLFLADGQSARVVGVNLQHPGSVAGPFAWCEAIGDLSVDARQEEQLLTGIDALVADLGLRGLNGIDFVFDEAGDPVVVEINPRPTATMMLYADRVDGGLFAAHLEACAGRLVPVARRAAQTVRGLRVVYARLARTVAPAVRWPAWASDLPQSGTVVPAGAPLCTVHASGADGDEVSALLRQRENVVQDMSGLHVEAGQTTTVFS